MKILENVKSIDCSYLSPKSNEITRFTCTDCNNGPCVVARKGQPYIKRCMPCGKENEPFESLLKKMLN